MSAEPALRRDGEARVHVLIAAGAMAASLAVNAPAAPLLVAAAALVHARASGARGPAIAGALAPAVLMAGVASAVRVLLARDGPVVALEVASLRVVAPAVALRAGAVTLAHVVAAAAIACWLRARISFARALGALAWCKVPRELLDLVAIARRYQDVLRRRGAAIRAAQTARLGYARPRRSLASAGRWLGRLACRALDQAAVTGDALRARGDRGHVPVAPPRRPRREDWAVALAALGVVALALTAARGSAW